MKNKSTLLNIVLAAVILALVFQLRRNSNKKPDLNSTLSVEQVVQQPDFDQLGHEEKSDNDVLATIFERKSVRHYTSQQVSKEQLTVLAKAGMAAPTAVDKRPWAFVAVTDRAMLNQLADVLPYAQMLRTATSAIVVCGDLSKALEGDAQAYWVQDCSAATQNILLAAEGIGLGAVWTGVHPIKDREDLVRKAINAPSHIVPLNVIAVGYPTGQDKPKDKWDESILHWEKW